MSKTERTNINLTAGWTSRSGPCKSKREIKEVKLGEHSRAPEVEVDEGHLLSCLPWSPDLWQPSGSGKSAIFLFVSMSASSERASLWQENNPKNCHNKGFFLLSHLSMASRAFCPGSWSSSHLKYCWLLSPGEKQFWRIFLLH